jgi:hypothetical protein
LPGWAHALRVDGLCRRSTVLCGGDTRLPFLAWEANARIALAVSELERARDCIANALTAMDGFEVPLAEWRVHATAGELSERGGDSGGAKQHHALSRAAILKLADSLPAGDPLRKTFLSAPRISMILAGG